MRRSIISAFTVLQRAAFDSAAVSVAAPVARLEPSWNLLRQAAAYTSSAAELAPSLDLNISPVRNFKVEATYVGTKIDIPTLVKLPQFTGHWRKLHKGAAALSLTPHVVPEKSEIEGLPKQPFMVAFSYGSVVFFDTPLAIKERFLAVCKGAAIEPMTADQSYNEEYGVSIVSNLPAWSQLEPESIRLQKLDLRNLHVIAQVLAQSVAMDYYASYVERTLNTFYSMNVEMKSKQNIARLNKEQLLAMVAENNILMTDIISKLGLHERYDIAWKDVQYGRIWEYLRTELEMENRFETLDMKLQLVQENLKYFLEILQNRKSVALEWTIIALIGAEICLSLYQIGMAQGHL